VILELEGNIYAMDYDKFGEYTAVLPHLLQGTHSAKVIATEGNLMAEDYVEFMISDHLLNISLISPNTVDTNYLSEKEPLEIKLDVFDETHDIVPGALVVAEILEPSGRAIETQVFQDPETGVYKAVFYPNTAGIYRMTVTASKQGYVSGSEDYTFTVEIQKPSIIPATISWETLLTIVLGLAILILLAALLKFIF
jgi:hypothetical protein